MTGARRALPRTVGSFLRDVRSVSPIPVAAGFGVTRPAHVRQLGRVADGVIVASALVDAARPATAVTSTACRVVRSLRAAT